MDKMFAVMPKLKVLMADSDFKVTLSVPVELDLYTVYDIYLDQQTQVISGSGSALLDPANLQALVDGCTDQEFRVQYKDEKKVPHQSHKSETGKRDSKSRL